MKTVQNKISTDNDLVANDAKQSKYSVENFVEFKIV